ncbi:hypothetical protein Tco_0803602 [Tanacetum coccineum]|uniref:Uncharacterized protein n=1 Tax=Tanacetum coccineum TaxID=301880 RepID=A0ABQ5A210_9ASTR
MINNSCFVCATTIFLLIYVPFYKQVLSFTIELMTVSSSNIPVFFYSLARVMPRYSPSVCLHAVTGWDQPPLQLMANVFCILLCHNLYVDFAELMWGKANYYCFLILSLFDPHTLRFRTISSVIIWTIIPEFHRRARDAYLNLQDDVKFFFYEEYLHFWKNLKTTVGMWIQLWMITDEMMLTENYKMLLQSRVKNRSKRNVGIGYEHLLAEEIEKLVEDTENVDDSSPHRLDDTLFHEKSEGKNVEESRIHISITNSYRGISSTLGIFGYRENSRNLMVYSSTPSSGSICTQSYLKQSFLYWIKAKPNDSKYKSFFHELQGRYGYLFAHLKKRFMPRTSSDQLADNLHDVMMEMLPLLVKEKVTEQVKKEVPAQVRDQVLVYLAEGLILERKTTKEKTERLISKAILQERGHMQAHISSQIQNAIDNAIPSLVDASVCSYMSGHILHVHPAQVQSSSIPEQQYQLLLAMKADPLFQQTRHSKLVGSPDEV